MISKKCICGKPVPPNFCFCASCQKKYGMDRTKWDEWLAFMVADLKREYEQEIEVSKNEDTFTDLGVDIEVQEACND